MSIIGEVFPNPTVKKVVFQIRFPNLFFIESKMGDIQIKIMNKFPESSLLFRRQVLVADFGPKTDFDKIKEEGQETSQKIWNFRNNNGIELNILNNALDISSSFHKTYDIEGPDEKFRDVIKFVLDVFLEITKIPLITRIGFRYIDECPLPSKDNDTFSSFYNSCFPIGRFPINNADEMEFKTVYDRGDCKIRYVESLQKKDNDYKLILDFDGFAENVDSIKYLDVTDKLHEVICKEFKATIKEPVYEYMRYKKV